jgi:hypothetical protein
MKVMAISLLILFLLPIASAIDFDFSSPQSVNLNESFSVSLSATTSDIYDVKILVQDNETKTTISEIYNDGWKNPFKYLLSAFPEKSEFSIRIKNYSSNAQICAQLRKPGASAYSVKKCNSIKIDKAEDSSSPQSNQTEEKEDNPQENESANETLTKKEASPDFIPSSEIIKQEESHSNNEKIILKPKTSSSENQFITKDEKMRLYAVYSFTFFAIIIIIFLALRKR